MKIINNKDELRQFLFKEIYIDNNPLVKFNVFDDPNEDMDIVYGQLLLSELNNIDWEFPIYINNINDRTYKIFTNKYHKYLSSLKTK